MGTGCRSSNRSFSQGPSDSQIKYTGPAIPSLGICTNDSLSEIESVILEKLVDFATGQGIALTADFTQCDVTNQFITCCADNNSLTGIVDVLIKSICALSEDVDDLSSSVSGGLSVTVNNQCLTIGANPSLQTILQAIIDSHCDLQTAFVDMFGSVASPALNSDIIDQISDQAVSDSLNQISSSGNYGLTKTGTGAATTLQFTGMVPPMCPIPYIGSLSNFDSTGAGLASAGYGGWFICNGNLGTPDMRGFAFAGATNVQGGSLISTVDPVVNLDSDYATNVGSRKGEVKHILTTTEMPSHTHTESDPGHVHTYSSPSTISIPQGDGENIQIAGPTTTSNSGASTTGIALSASGESQAHENRQPTYYGVWIMRFN